MQRIPEFWRNVLRQGGLFRDGQASVGLGLALHWVVSEKVKAETGKALASCFSVGEGQAVPTCL